MNKIVFECDVTEFNVTPPKENEENVFELFETGLVINLINSKNKKIMMQTEIEKKSAIQLAKLILLKYT